MGHFHAKRLKMAILDEDQAGVRIRIQPTLCPRDAWHAGMGYWSRRAAEGYVYHKARGLLVEYIHTPMNLDDEK
jgi:hypothetical protein